MTFAPGDAHDICIYGGRFRIIFPIFNEMGDMLPGCTGINSVCSVDQRELALCVNATAEIPIASALYYLDLTVVETMGSNVSVMISSDSFGAKTTVLSIPIVRLPVMESGTTGADSISDTIVLATGASTINGFYNGLYVQLTNDSPTNTIGQTRKIISYTGSSRTAQLDSPWGTIPQATTTYDILFPSSTNVSANGLPDAIWGKAGADPIGPPLVGAPLGEKLNWLTAMFRNKKTVDRVSGVASLRNDADTGTITTTTVTDDGTVFTRPKAT